jgi:hypothetical protein
LLKIKYVRLVYIEDKLKSLLKTKKFISIYKPLELLHLNLFGPTSIASLEGKKYAQVVVDDYFRFS